MCHCSVLLEATAGAASQRKSLRHGAGKVHVRMRVGKEIKPGVTFHSQSWEQLQPPLSCFSRPISRCVFAVLPWICLWDGRRVGRGEGDPFLPCGRIPENTVTASLTFPCCSELSQGSQGFVVPPRAVQGSPWHSLTDSCTWGNRNAQPRICLTKEVKREEGSKETVKNWLSHKELTAVTADLKVFFKKRALKRFCS